MESKILVWGYSYSPDKFFRISSTTVNADQLRGIPVYTLPDVYQTFWYKLPSSLLQDKWLAFSDGFNLMPGYFSMKLKRVVHLILILFLLILVAPLLLLVALLIRLDNPGQSTCTVSSEVGCTVNHLEFINFAPCIRMQKSWGRSGLVNAIHGSLDSDIGYVLLRIDELPRYGNVLQGEMSLIGPSSRTTRI